MSSNSDDHFRNHRTRGKGVWARALVPVLFAVIAVLAAAASLGGGGAEPRLLAGVAAVAAGLAMAVVLWSQRRGRRDEGFFFHVFEASSIGRMIVGPSGRVVHANAAFRNLIGDSDAPIDALESLFGDEAAAEIAQLRAAAAAGRKAQAEMLLRRGASAGEWREIVVNPLATRPGFTTWNVEDITARRQMEQVIREDQQKLVNFVENAPIGFYSVDADGRFMFVNHVFADWLGMTPKALLDGARRLGDFLVEGVASGTPYSPFPPKSGAEFSEESGNESGEVLLMGEGGHGFQAHIAQRLVPGADGNGPVIHSVVRDLTQIREWERALSRSQYRLDQFFAAAPIGIVLLDADARVEFANRAFLDMAGQRLEEIGGRGVIDIFGEEDRVPVAERLAGARADGAAAIPLDVRLTSGGGTVASLYVSRMRQEEGGDTGHMLHLIDTTEQKNLEMQFAQSQKMQAVGQLAGGVAHDFNNLLTAMIGFCDLLLLRHKPGEESFADIMQIKQNANRAANLVRQLLAFSRQQTLQPKVLNLTDVVADITNLLRRLIGARIELRTIHDRDLGLVKVDQGQIEQVIINLAVNARDAMADDGGTITIRTSNARVDDSVEYGHEMLPVGDYVLIEIDDAGTGIAAEHLGRIFEPFFSTKAVGSGTGLGLSTVYGIVKQTGGYIFVKSALGRGTTFSIFLPRHAEEPAVVNTEVEYKSKDLTGARTVLLVEDEDAVRQFSVRALRNKG
ncbi:MAG: PAS domain-containing sensor histidine kinase, partial [Alphaproteobacteria bacterium]